METKIKGKIRFINDDEKNPNKVVITFEVDNVMASMLEDDGVKIKANTYKNVYSLLAKGTLYKNYVHIYRRRNNEVEMVDYENSRLMYGVECIFKCHTKNWEYMGRNGVTLIIDSIAIVKEYKTNTFTNDELEEVFKE